MLQQAWFALCIAFAWYFVLSACTALAFVSAHGPTRKWLSKDTGARRALIARLLPVGITAGIVVGLVLPAFAWLEPARSVARGERLGATATVLAAAGAVLLLMSVTRGLATVFRTRGRVRALFGAATPVTDAGSGATLFVGESPVPYVLLDGLVRPRLFVSRSVLDGLTPDELQRAIAHELAHHHARDNVKRHVLAFVPDLISGSRLARELEVSWKRSAELEADAVAARDSDAHAVTLASALVKVARLAAGRPPIDLGRAAFYDGAPVAERIRALCSRRAAGSRTSVRASRVLGATAFLLSVGACLNAPTILAGVHRLTELLVHLP